LLILSGRLSLGGKYPAEKQNDVKRHSQGRTKPSNGL